MAEASPGLVWSFFSLALLVAACVPAAVYAAGLRTSRSREAARRDAVVAALLVLAWVGATGGAAAAGWVRFDTRPPTMTLLFAAILGVSAWLGFSRVGERIAAGVPLALLVGVQGFRLPLELLMHRAYEEGVMPVQMSYSGLNFDVLTGITALAAGALLAAGRLPLWAARAWNVLGSVLVATIVTIAWLSAPTPLRVFHNEPANVWIARFPFVWLPTVLVAAALAGHVLVFRRLRMEAAKEAQASKTKVGVAAA